jgi:hypothetical protein
MAPKKRKVPKQVLQRLLNAAQSFRDLTEVPSTALTNTFESEFAARAALMDATLHEAHHAFSQPISSHMGHDPTLHAIDLGRIAPGIVAETSESIVQVFSQTNRPQDRPAEDQPIKKPRIIRRQGCMRAVTSAAKLDEKRADEAVARRDRPKCQRKPKQSKDPSTSASIINADVASAELAETATDTTKTAESSDVTEPDSTVDSAVSTKKSRQTKPLAPPDETMMIVTPECLATDHDLYECPTSWVQQLRVLSGEDTILNLAMSEALTMGKPSNAVQLVVGSPGTGKSVVLIRRVAEAVDGGATRVLLTAPTNLATADLYRRLLTTFPKTEPVLAMRLERVIGPLTESEVVGRHDPESSEVETAHVIVATAATVTLASMRRGRPFSHIFVDEAGLLPEAACWCLLRGTTQELTLCGDPAQLESVVSEAGRDLGFGRSLFRRLLDIGYPTETLNVQRRMHPEISRLTGDRFYSGQVIDDYTQPLDIPEQLLGVATIVAEGTEVKEGTSWANDWEADRAVTAATALKKLMPNRSVVILVPYGAQLARVKARLQADIEVATVDSFQGREADVIVLSMVRDRCSGFWSDDGRLCVALTRARHHLTVLAGPGWADLLS